MYEINDVRVVVETTSGLHSDYIFVREWDYKTEAGKDMLTFDIDPVNSSVFGDYTSVSISSVQIIINSVSHHRLHFNPVNLGSVDSLCLHVSLEVEDLDEYNQLIF